MSLNIPYGKQEITQEDIDAVVNVLTADFLTQGPAVSKFEEKFSDYVGAKYAVAVSNGTAALHLACMALDVCKEKKVLTSPMSFAATSNSILYCGGIPEFVDIDSDTYLIDINRLEECLKKSPPGTYSGIIAVDFAGLPVNSERIRKLADQYDLWLIEDACHAPGASFIDSEQNRVQCGSGLYADLTCFSFHPVKHIACGEGGMVTTNNLNLYNKLKDLRTHGITKDPDLMKENHGGWYYEMNELGYNYRLPDINCALGISQLSKAEERLNRRIEIAEMYTKAFQEVDEIKCQLQVPHYVNAYHLFIIEIPDRLHFYNYLKSHHIHAQIHYIPIHLQPYYKKLGWKKGDYPVAENYYEHCISLPMYPSLSDEEQNEVIKVIIKFFKDNS